MPYESVDKLQQALATNVFNYTKDPKKASGRALGTIIEIITYYLLKSWGLNDDVSIERGLAEYGNPDITHNVEFSLHPIIRSSLIVMEITGTTPVSSRKILDVLLEVDYNLDGFTRTSNQLLNNGILRNACTIAISEKSFLLCSIKEIKGDVLELHVYEQNKKPYSVFECKRVGVEEGMKKGPQTIEKAKQGAYVARAASSLQKIRSEKGEMMGIIYKSDHSYIVKPFIELMEEVINSNDRELLRRFILTVGVVSNHGNWFTAENHNKELKVLAQSYDWLLLLFLTDSGLAQFIDELLVNPSDECIPVQRAFQASYTGQKVKNQFTKVQMNLEADTVLLNYFKKNLQKIESWFNIISPKERTLDLLKNELTTLKNKNWEEILI